MANQITVSFVSGGERPFHGAKHKILDNGTLQVDDTESGKRFTYSPSYWACVTEDKPRPKASSFV